MEPWVMADTYEMAANTRSSEEKRSARTFECRIYYDTVSYLLKYSISHLTSLHIPSIAAIVDSMIHQAPAIMDAKLSKQKPRSYWEAIVSNRSHAKSLQQSSDGNTSGHNLFEKMATLNINYRINEERHHRCPDCWYCNVRCVCDLMPTKIDREDLPNIDVKILLLLHHKEYLNAGNSAKSLIALLPKENIELYVYGREGDFDRFIDEMMIDQGRQTAILWPGENAITVEEFTSSCLPTQSNNPKMTKSVRSNHVTVENTYQAYKEQTQLLRIVALDGTYKNAKNMHKTIRRRLDDEKEHAMPACIALHPKSVSQFHRAKKNYGAAIHDNLKANDRLDERALRVSTAEACALLLMELGAKDIVQEKIMKALLVNNCNRTT